MRQIVLDTETTGLETKEGHRIIEFGCLELINRKLTGRHLHFYFNPDRKLDQGALEIHGITQEFLLDKPRFFEKIEEIMDFVKGSELLIHNAPFDLGFLNYELSLLEKNTWGKIETHAKVLDTLKLARHQHPGQRNSLDALCKRYSVDNHHRTYHGALKDAELLAEVYLAMTGGQIELSLSESKAKFQGSHNNSISALSKNNIMNEGQNAVGFSSAVSQERVHALLSMAQFEPIDRAMFSGSLKVAYADEILKKNKEKDKEKSIEES